MVDEKPADWGLRVQEEADGLLVRLQRRARGVRVEPDVQLALAHAGLCHHRRGPVVEAVAAGA